MNDVQKLWEAIGQETAELEIQLEQVGAVALAELPATTLKGLDEEGQARELHSAVRRLEEALLAEYPAFAPLRRHTRVWAEGDDFPEGDTFTWRIRMWLQLPEPVRLGEVRV
ncbi:MAG: hypothetical protein ICV87_08705 [Gemmatimonadetes bacterium]|nr:hypothetical protein [Gemmatimonadota bacterium]